MAFPKTPIFNNPSNTKLNEKYHKNCNKYKQQLLTEVEILNLSLSLPYIIIGLLHYVFVLGQVSKL